MYIISLCLLIQGALLAATELVLNPLCPNMDATFTTLNMLATQKTRHSQEMIHRYYARIVKNESLLGGRILMAYGNKNTIDEYVIMLLVNRGKDQGLYESLEILYGIRSEWWHIPSLRNKIISIY